VEKPVDNLGETCGKLVDNFWSVGAGGWW